MCKRIKQEVETLEARFIKAIKVAETWGGELEVNVVKAVKAEYEKVEGTVAIDAVKLTELVKAEIARIKAKEAFFKNLYEVIKKDIETAVAKE